MIDPTLTFDTLSSTSIYDGNFLHIVQDKVEMPNGRVVTREYVNHPGAVAIIATTQYNELILIKQYRHPVKQIVLEVPAGTCELHETTWQTAGRELKEETGYKFGTIGWMFDFFPSPGYTSEVVHMFRARGCCRDLDSQPENGIEVVLMPLDELNSLVFPGHLSMDAKTWVAVTYMFQEGYRYRRESQWNY